MVFLCPLGLIKKWSDLFLSALENVVFVILQRTKLNMSIYAQSLKHEFFCHLIAYKFMGFNIIPFCTFLFKTRCVTFFRTYILQTLHINTDLIIIGKSSDLSLTVGLKSNSWKNVIFL